MSHDGMDRAAQGYQDFVGDYGQADEATQQIYAGVFSQGEMSLKDRILATGILSGALPPTAVAEAQERADSPAGKKGIALAAEVMMQNPALGMAAAQLAEQEIALFAKERQMGVSAADVVAASEQGAGVSPLPAVLGGAGVGSGVAIVDALMRRRGRS